MTQVARKLRRVRPLIDMKKALVDSEVALLNHIRAEKSVLAQAMTEAQKAYMAGVEKLNQTRASLHREALESHETALDFAKEQWWSCYRRLQNIEKKEQEQLHVVRARERELQAVKKLQSRYEGELRTTEKKTDQRDLDEFALRAYIGRE